MHGIICCALTLFRINFYVVRSVIDKLISCCICVVVGGGEEWTCTFV